MADSGFDSGPPSKKSKTSSPSSSVNSFDPDTADLSRLLNELSDVLSPELTNTVPRLQTIEPIRKFDDTIQSNQHLSALLGTDLLMLRGHANIEIPRFPMNTPGTVPHQHGAGTVNWSVRQPLNITQYRIPAANLSAAETTSSQPDVPQQNDFLSGMANYVSGSGPLPFTPGFVRGKPNPAGRMMYTTAGPHMRVRMPMPGTPAFGAGMVRNMLPPGAQVGVNGGEKLREDLLMNETYSMSSAETIMKQYGARPSGAISQTYPMMDVTHNAISEMSAMAPASDVQPMMARAPTRASLNPASCEMTQIPPVAVKVRFQSDVHNNTEKQRLIQQQLVLIFHAHKCHRREQANGAHQLPCPLPQCQPMKNVLRHMVTCTEGRSCRVPHCASSRQIIAHWRNCIRLDCPICAPLKNGTLRQLMPPAAVAPSSGPVPPTDANPVYEGFSPKHATAVHASDSASVSQMSLASSVVNIGATYGGPKSLQGSLGEEDITPAPGQDWRCFVTQDLRNHLVHKLVQAIFPTHEPMALKDPRMSNLVRYAKKVEGDMYEKARSREDYYHLLAEKIYKIQKELEQKKLRRISDQNGLKQAPLRVTSSDSLGTPSVGSQSYPMTSPSSPPFVSFGETLNSTKALQCLNPSSTTSAFLESTGITPSLSRSVEISGESLNSTSINLLPMSQTAAVNQIRDGTKMGPFHSQSVVPNSTQVDDNAQNVHASLQTDSKLQLTNVLTKRCHEIELMEKRQIQSDLMSSASQGMNPFLPTLPRGTLAAPGNFVSSLNQGWDKMDKTGSVIKQEKTFLGHDLFFSPGSMTTLVPGSESTNQMMGNHMSDDTFVFDPMSMPSLSSDDFKVDIKHEDITDDEMAAKSVSIENREFADGNSNVDAPSKKEIEVKMETNNDYSLTNMEDLLQKSESLAKSFVKSEPDVKVEVKTESMDGGDLTKPNSEASDQPGTSEMKNSSENSQAETATKSDVHPGKRTWTSEELEHAFLPIVDRLYSVEPEAVPFRAPVDPVALYIPDYFHIVKNPMDLSTIRSKLETGAYTDPWNFIDDILLMFDNAWLYNRKTSKVYKYCTKLAEVFESEIDPVMQSFGFCCGRRFVFTPQVLCCFGKQLCVIPRDSTYYSYLDRYIYCEKCFNELHSDEIEILDDPSNPGLKIKKESFVKEKNDKLDPEPMVDCLECGRRMHKICALHFEQIWSTGFVCNPCRKATGVKRKENKYTAKRLPMTKLGSYLENRVNALLKRKAACAGDVTVRVLSSYDKVVEVKPAMKARFVDQGMMSESFPYRVKAIFAFEEIDGVDVCFFGMHVQEYGSDCAANNARRVYVAYLDSVNFFQPRQFRTMVYHELLIGYMDYVKGLGYQMAHIWACPPSEGDDYIFYCHPPDMKIPKPKRLQEWYRKMLDKALCDHVIFDYKDILKDAIDNNLQSVSELPYFEGDFWPNVLEESIKEVDQEMAKRQREEEEAAVDTDDGEVNDGNSSELQTIAGKKKDQKSGQTKKKNPKTKKLPSRRSKSGLAHISNDLSERVLMNMDKHKEVFFVIRLQSKSLDSELPDIKDPDPLINNELLDGRDPLLTMARERHLEFSSLRRAKFSTMALLYELHMQAKDSFIYTCNNCKASVETRYHCLVCEDFDLCVACFRKLQHPHRMTKLGLDLDDGSQGDAKLQNPQEARRLKIQTYVQVLEHSCICRDANCTLASCRNMRKALMIHPKKCSTKSRTACATCKQLFTLCCYHAKACREKRCHVPFCQNIKTNLEKQRQKERLQQQMLMRRRVAVMHRVDDASQASSLEQRMGPAQVTPSHPSYSGIPSDGKTGKSPQMLGKETMYHPTGQPFGAMSGDVPSPMPQYPSSRSEFPASGQPYGDSSGWVSAGTSSLGQFSQPESFIQSQGKQEVVVDGANPGSSTASGQMSLERLWGTEDKQKLLAVLKANPRIMAEFIKKLRQQGAVNQQIKQQQQQSPGMPGSSVQSAAAVDGGGMRNPMVAAFPQQPVMNMALGRQMMPSAKMTPNGDHSRLLQQPQMVEYHQPPQMMSQGFDGYQPGMMPCQPYTGFPVPGSPAMSQDYSGNRGLGRMPFPQSQQPRHIHPQMMNHPIHRQPHGSVMNAGGYTIPQDMMAAAQGGLQLQPLGDPSSVMCSMPSVSPISTSSPRPASNNCSPLPHHLPPHYMNKVLPHSADVAIQRTVSVGLQPNSTVPNPLCPDATAMRQLCFSPSGKTPEIPLSRSAELAESMQFSVTNTFSHYMDRK